ncbi:MAG: GAP family protein [Pseudonocardia sp.]|nr:GAP family protein [Pseudonocardia sp.]
MSVEVLVLALSAVFRPTSAAAVVVMLSTSRPQRLLTCYVLAGLAFSLGVGALVLALFQNLGPVAARTARPVLDVVLGLAALAYAGATWSGHLPRRATGGTGMPGWLRQRMQDLSPSGAAVLGVLTHLPGVVYLAALNAIAGDASGTLNEVVQLSIYNAFWFAVPLVALVLSAYRPALARDRLERATSSVGRHRTGLVVVLFGALGGYLLVTGAADLAGR